jgi:hypothetical protein
MMLNGNNEISAEDEIMALLNDWQK